jgi:hypothetical protein
LFERDLIVSDAYGETEEVRVDAEVVRVDEAE